MKRAEVGSVEELQAALRELGAVRLTGTSTKQHELPALDAETTALSTGPLQRILRLEPEDFTCTVEPGVRRDELDAELNAAGMELPCADRGTLGGIFAMDRLGPLAPSAFSPRSLLLGFSGVLATGETFKAGARVVKSVAGFDLQKLFVGSQGRLFAVHELHLKLRPKPGYVARYKNSFGELGAAIALYHGLRRLADPPRAIMLHGSGQAGWYVHAELAGHAQLVSRTAVTLELQETDENPPLQLGKPATVAWIRPSRVAELLRRQAPETDVVVSGMGRVELARTSDVVASNEPAGVVADLEQRLKHALDPRGVLR